MKSERTKHVEERPARGETRAERPQRVPINGDIDILTVKGIRPDYHPCWVNERLVPRYLNAGYTFVDYDVSFGQHHVNQGNPLGARYVRDVGMGVQAYLMEIPQEYFDEDRASEEKLRQDQEGSMLDKARAAGLDHGDLQLPKSQFK